MRVNNDLILPHGAHTQTGIQRCIQKAAELVDDAERLAQAGGDLHAAILYSFAIEEFGKAALLRDAVDREGEPVRVAGFYDHRVKIARAADLLDPRLLLLVEGAFQLGAFQRNAFQVDDLAVDIVTRLRSLWTDWDEPVRNWYPRLQVSAGLLTANIVRLRQRLGEIRAEWVPEP